MEPNSSWLARGCGSTPLPSTCGAAVASVLLAAVLGGALTSLLVKGPVTSHAAADVLRMDNFEALLCAMYLCFHLVCLGSIAHQVVRYTRLYSMAMYAPFRSL